MKEAPTREERAGAGEGHEHPHHINADSIPEPTTGTERKELLEAAQRYLARGLTPIRLGLQSKQPVGKHDANTLTADNAERLIAAGGYNLGLRLGPDHGGLVDFDLDWPEARRLGGLLLDRFARFGRAGAQGSHYVLCSPDPVKSRKFDIPELSDFAGLPKEHAICVLEVRASGYTMVPPSVHPNGEAVAWEREAALLEDTASGIYQRAGLLAFLSVVLHFYPAQGSRDDVCMALSGSLLAAGLAPGEADRCIVAVAEAAGDEEAAKRGKAVQTAAKMEEGEAATGIPRLVELLGLPEAVAGRFRRWLGIAGRQDARPKVVYSENRLPETLDAAEDALLAAGVPIYQMSGRLVRPVRLDASGDDDGVRRGAGALLIRELRPHRLRELMIGAANFVELRSKADGTVVELPTAPPLTFAQSYAARDDAWRPPVLRGVVECPNLREDGTVLQEDGYDAASGLILDTGGLAFAPVPDAPTREEAVAALAKLKWIVKDFPFVDDASRSVALSAMLTAVCRRSLRTAPMHGFSAPTMSTGKSLLADVVATLATGRDAPVMSQARDEEEERKRLLSILMQGDPVISIDNVSRPISGDVMCSILTQESWQDRRLGSNDQQMVSTRALWMVNGNNLEFREDMSTRAILCTMDAGVAKPEERHFDVDLRVEVPKRRGELVAAALAVLRAYAVAGRPGASDLTPFGRFEQWSDTVRAALVWAGEADPCETRAAVAVGDSAGEELAELIEAWAEVVDIGTVVRAADLVRRANEEASTGPGGDRLLQALEAACPRGVNARSVGVYLKTKKGRIVGGRRIVAVAEGNMGKLWRLEEAGR